MTHNFKNILKLFSFLVAALSLTTPVAFAMDLSPFSDLGAYYTSKSGDVAAAQIKQEGQGNKGEITQTMDPTALSDGGSFAEIIQTGSVNQAYIRQEGKVNNASVTQSDTNNYASLAQIGTNNANVEQKGSNNHALTMQDGSLNSIELKQSDGANFFSGTQDGVNNKMTVVQPGSAISTMSEIGNNNSITLIQKVGGLYDIKINGNNITFEVTQR